MIIYDPNHQWSTSVPTVLTHQERSRRAERRGPGLFGGLCGQEAAAAPARWRALHATRRHVDFPYFSPPDKDGFTVGKWWCSWNFMGEIMINMMVLCGFTFDNLTTCDCLFKLSNDNWWNLVVNPTTTTISGWSYTTHMQTMVLVYAHLQFYSVILDVRANVGIHIPAPWWANMEYLVKIQGMEWYGLRWGNLLHKWDVIPQRLMPTWDKLEEHIGKT